MAELNVTPAEATLFHIVGYGTTLLPDELPGYAACDMYSVAGPATEDGCRAALAECLAKGWLQVIDEAILAAITDGLRRDRVLGPLCGFPTDGGVDFTSEGAALWRRFRDRTRDTPRANPYAYSTVVHRKTTRFFRTREAAVAERELTLERAGGETVTVEGPFPTGPWRAQWWRRFPAGYRIDIEERARWHCSGDEGECCCPPYLPERADSQRLRAVLARRNVAPAEWAVLAALEDGPRSVGGGRLFWWHPESVEREYGTAISREEFLAGVESCRSRGWVRALNRESIAEVRTLLRNDPTALAIPKTAELFHHACHSYIDPSNPGDPVYSPIPAGEGWGEIDFTPAGADLYRVLSAEWLGPDWEDALAVSHGYYREEHRYCEAEEGFAGIVEEYVAKGGVVRSCRVVPIGPWCVHWWERFPSGVRLELEIEP